MNREAQFQRGLLLVKVGKEGKVPLAPSLSEFHAKVAALRQYQAKLELYLAKVQRAIEDRPSLREYLTAEDDPNRVPLLRMVDVEWEKLYPTDKPLDRDKPDWLKLDDARGKSIWRPLVPFLAKAMLENPWASRAQLANQFSVVCDRYDDARDYCDKNGIEPAAMNLDSLGKLRRKAEGFLDRQT